MEPNTNTTESPDLEALNGQSEQAIREDYLKAAIHGPRWVLALVDQAN